MYIKSIKTERVSSRSCTLIELVDRSLPSISDGSILAVTSKVVSLCEGSVRSSEERTKDDLIKQEASYYLPDTLSQYGYHFTITQNTLIAAAGIDESNGDGNYILWPSDSQKTANELWKYLVKKHNLSQFGVIITDSTCSPMRRGTMGIVLAHAGFEALHNYTNEPDLFGRPIVFSQASIANGLAASAVLAMGEGSEQTPLALIDDVEFVRFQNRPPTEAELNESYVSKEDDLFRPFLDAVRWQKGDK